MFTIFEFRPGSEPQEGWIGQGPGSEDVVRLHILLCALHNKCIAGIGLQDQHEGTQTHHMVKAWGAVITYTIGQANGVSHTYIHTNTNTHVCAH